MHSSFVSNLLGHELQIARMSWFECIAPRLRASLEAAVKPRTMVATTLAFVSVSSMLFLPDPTCFNLFQSVSCVLLRRPCSKNLAPNAKKHVLGSTKRRTKSTTLSERIYRARTTSTSRASQILWKMTRFKMLQDASRCCRCCKMLLDVWLDTKNPSQRNQH